MATNEPTTSPSDVPTNFPTTPGPTSCDVQALDGEVCYNGKDVLCIGTPFMTFPPTAFGGYSVAECGCLCNGVGAAFFDTPQADPGSPGGSVVIPNSCRCFAADECPEVKEVAKTPPGFRNSFGVVALGDEDSREDCPPRKFNPKLFSTNYLRAYSISHNLQ